MEDNNMNVERVRLAEVLVKWASMKRGPYSEIQQKNMVIELYKSRANLETLIKLEPREKMHDLNFILSKQRGLICGEICLCSH